MYTNRAMWRETRFLTLFGRGVAEISHLFVCLSLYKSTASLSFEKYGVVAEISHLNIGGYFAAKTGHGWALNLQILTLTIGNLRFFLCFCNFSDFKNGVPFM